jgi:hypothetical protein
VSTDPIEPWVRAAVKFRANGRCEWCGIGIDRPEIHHRLFRSRGGGHGPENLVALCGWGNTTGCHGRAHTDAAAAEAAGMSIPGGGDPFLVPIASVMFGGLTMWIHADGFTSFDGPDTRPTLTTGERETPGTIR